MAKSALLVMDVQQGIVERFPHSEYIQKLRYAIEAARASGVPVI